MFYLLIYGKYLHMPHPKPPTIPIFWELKGLVKAEEWEKSDVRGAQGEWVKHRFQQESPLMPLL